MCRAQADGGRRCVCPPPQRRATRRAKYAADRIATGEVAAPDAGSSDAADLPARPVDSVTPVSAADLTATLKDLRREIVSDDSAPDAALAYAEEISRQRLEAVGRGAATDHRWSLANRALLIRQARQRGASVVGWFAGPRQWDNADREVLPGAVPYEVWAPVIGRSTNTDDDEDGQQPGERSLRTVESRVRFRAVAVFDYSQTRRRDGQPDPDWQPSIPGGDEALYERMVASSPLPVVEDHAGGTGKAHGRTDGRVITLDARKSVGSRIETLAHEHAHVQGDHLGRIARGEITREHAEQEAGLAAYLVVRQLGLGDDSDATALGNAVAYLRSWATPDGGEVAGHKARWRMLGERLGPATEAAQVILARFLGLDCPAD